MWLDGTRVLALVENYPGPLATRILNDLGAEIIQVERPSGDPLRAYPGWYDALNRGKTLVVADLADERDRLALTALARDADVILDGYRPGQLDRSGFAPSDWKLLAPQASHVSITPFGREGPLAGQGAHDILIQAMSGWLVPSDTGSAPPGNGAMIGSLVTGLYAALAVVASLRFRERSGQPVAIDLAARDALVSFLGTHLEAVASGSVPDRFDPGYGTYASADGRHYCISIAYEDRPWTALAQAIGLPEELARLTHPERLAREDELRRAVAKAFALIDSGTLDRVLAAARIPSSVVFSPGDVLADPGLLQRGVLREGSAGAGATIGSPLKPLGQILSAPAQLRAAAEPSTIASAAWRSSRPGSGPI